MSERRQILTLVGLTLIVGVASVTLIWCLSFSVGGGDIVVDEYRATFYPDGTLVEEYTYDIRVKKFRMLFRVWEAPLSADALGSPYIEPLEIEGAPGAIGYYRDHTGWVSVDEPYRDDWGVINTIASLAYRNEVGSYNTDMYDPGRYRVRYTFDVHPPIEYDDEAGHLNLKLADEHIPYMRVTIVLEDASYIENLYTHPLTYDVSEEGDRIVMTGSSGEDELVEVEMLIDLDAIEGLDGFPTRVEGVRSKTINANKVTSFKYLAASYLGSGTRALALLMPFLIYAVYHLYGREREYTVPNYLSYVPNRSRKPWLVNQIFVRGVLDYDDDGFYATLLDLHLRKKIRIGTKPGGLLIKILDDDLDDRYERRVMDLLQMLAEHGVFDTDRLEDYTKMIKEGEDLEISDVARLRRLLIELTTYVDERLASEFIVSGRRRLLPLLFLAILVAMASFGMIVLAPFAGAILLPPIFTSFVPLIQVIMALMFPATLFGVWRGDAYREKLEWGAFARHLSELSQIRRYAPEDIDMWGEWLVYGTALGVGDSVVRAMRALDVDVPEVGYVSMMPVYFHPLVVASAPSRGRVSGFGGGGGGGFGGGGAGAR